MGWSLSKLIHKRRKNKSESCESTGSSPSASSQIPKNASFNSQRRRRTNAASDDSRSRGNYPPTASEDGRGRGNYPPKQHIPLEEKKSTMSLAQLACKHDLYDSVPHLPEIVNRIDLATLTPKHNKKKSQPPPSSGDKEVELPHANKRVGIAPNTKTDPKDEAHEETEKQATYPIKRTASVSEGNVTNPLAHEGFPVELAEACRSMWGKSRLQRVYQNTEVMETNRRLLTRSRTRRVAPAEGSPQVQPANSKHRNEQVQRVTHTGGTSEAMKERMDGVGAKHISMPLAKHDLSQAEITNSADIFNVLDKPELNRLLPNRVNSVHVRELMTKFTEVSVLEQITEEQTKKGVVRTKQGGKGKGKPCRECREEPFVLDRYLVPSNVRNRQSTANVGAKGTRQNSGIIDARGKPSKPTKPALVQTKTNAPSSQLDQDNNQQTDRTILGKYNYFCPGARDKLSGTWMTRHRRALSSDNINLLYPESNITCCDSKRHYPDATSFNMRPVESRNKSRHVTFAVDSGKGSGKRDDDNDSSLDEDEHSTKDIANYLKQSQSDTSQNKFSHLSKKDGLKR